MTNKTAKKTKATATSKAPRKRIIDAKTKIVDIKNGEDLVVILNETQAWDYGILASDKVTMVIN